MNQEVEIKQSDIDFISGIINSIEIKHEYELPSKYNERTRYLPKELTGKPGYVNYDYTPFHREIVDNFSPTSPIKETAVVKPAQIGFTTMVLEALINYYMGSNPRPMIYVTADKELAEKGMETKVERMIDEAGLRELIRPQTAQKTKKTGDRTTEKEYPGGFLHAIGALNPGKLRSMSYPIGLVDEFDAFPATLKNEGAPEDLLTNRIIIPYESSYKILYGSTPLISQTSKILKLYEEGDQRNFFVPCVHCGEMIVLHWHLKESQTKTGDRAGIVFDVTESGGLVEDSVYYKCQECGKLMVNDQKIIIFKDGLWKPTSESLRPELRSYWVNALYSPVGMFSWEGMAKSFLNCWDFTRNKVKDIEKYRSFRNTKEGKGFEQMGESPKYERVIQHQRNYIKNQIPNKLCIQDNGNPILVLICSCDVHKNNIKVDIKGYTKNGISYTVDYRNIEGQPENINDSSWTELAKIIEEETWTADDGKVYRIRNTFIDSGYATDTVYQFCSSYSFGVYPTFGEQWIKGETRGLTFKQASKQTIEKAGCLVFKINTTVTKDRVAKSFRTDWNSGEDQPEWKPNFPTDFRDDYFREFEAEYKAEKVDKVTGKSYGFFWYQIPGRDNHAFDTFGGNIAALECLAEYVCIERLGMDALNWVAFWEYAAKGNYYEIKT